MQENQTFEAILERLLDGGRAAFPELDTREGSLIHSAFGPAAAELSRLYTALNFALEMSYADTASRDYLIRRAAERGMAPRPATKAVIEAAVEPANVQILQGARFHAGAVVYVMRGRSAANRPLLEAETAGTVGNLSGGRLMPVDLVSGLQTASIHALAVPGSDEEATEAFRARYMG
ncbi:MAG: baseplate J/gp47 family protein, partial [Oscillospiraceae bacterium]|nr:baseplate J/gp47 family protein [Oscillospiraceae bacterium]